MNIRPMKIEEAEIILNLSQEACIEAVGHRLGDTSAKRILHNLRAYVDHEDCFCLVAEVENMIVGYVTFCLMNHPIQRGYAGEIEELYILPAYRSQKVGEQLVHDAVISLKKRNAGVILTRVAIDEPEALAFWNGLGWAQDTVNFTIYSHVPGDPELQATWDQYSD